MLIYRQRQWWNRWCKFDAYAQWWEKRESSKCFVLYWE